MSPLDIVKGQMDMIQESIRKSNNLKKMMSECPEGICDGSGKITVELAPDDIIESDCLCKAEPEDMDDDSDNLI